MAELPSMSSVSGEMLVRSSPMLRDDLVFPTSSLQLPSPGSCGLRDVGGSFGETARFHPAEMKLSTDTTQYLSQPSFPNILVFFPEAAERVPAVPAPVHGRGAAASAGAAVAAREAAEGCTVSPCTWWGHLLHQGLSEGWESLVGLSGVSQALICNTWGGIRTANPPAETLGP